MDSGMIDPYGGQELEATAEKWIAEWMDGNLQHGTHGFTSLPKEIILGIFMLWKIHRPRMCLNQRTSDPVASMITTGQPVSTI